MRSRELFREWMKGCDDCPNKRKPWECNRCTLPMLEAINSAMDQEEEQQREEREIGLCAQLSGEGLISALRKRFGGAIDDAVRRELGDVCEQRDNAETSNHGLRVELHMTQMHLGAAQAAVTQLAKGAGLTKSQHLNEVAELSAQLAKARAKIADLERARR